jgi:hypothetical protein
MSYPNTHDIWARRAVAAMLRRCLTAIATQYLDAARALRG